MVSRRSLFWIGGFLAAAIALTLLLVRRGDDETLRVLDGVSVQFVLKPADTSGLPATPDPAFEVAPDGTLVMTANGSLLGLQIADGGVAVEQLAENAPRAYAIDAEGNLLGIDRGYLGQYENGGFSLGVPLPIQGLRMAGSTNPGAVYLFGGADASANHVYTVYRDGLLDVLAELSAPVVGVADSSAAVYVATERAIYRIAPEAQNVAFRISDDAPPIRSIAACNDSVVYFSTASRVYAVRGLAAIAVVSNMGGVVRCRGDSLYVWSPERRVLAHLTDLDSALSR